MNWKYRVLNALGTAIFYMLILWLFDCFSEDNLYSIKSLLFQGIFFGVFVGIGFPYISKKFAGKYSNKLGKNIQPTLQNKEQIEIEEPANLFRGIEGIGGKIFLTNKKLIFKSHKINIQQGQTDINFQDIKEVLKRKTAKLINNGIRIITRDGKKYDFVVNECDVWLEKIKERLK